MVSIYTVEYALFCVHVTGKEGRALSLFLPPHPLRSQKSKVMLQRYLWIVLLDVRFIHIDWTLSVAMVTENGHHKA